MELVHELDERRFKWGAREVLWCSRLTAPRTMLRHLQRESSQQDLWVHVYDGRRTETKQRYLGYELFRFLSYPILFCWVFLHPLYSQLMIPSDSLVPPPTFSPSPCLRYVERPMKIEIVVDPARPAHAQSLASRVAPPAAAAVAEENQGTRLV